ncbi:preprotein translocase subunit SecA [Candidatus Parcubacteria bacterium]|nr:MAG: preprotein translocase subunit SecA [Candidatus Parcubacteria bacterium]
MLGRLSKLFDTNEREVNKLIPIVNEINSLEEHVQKLKDKDFVKKTEEFRQRVKEGENIYLLLPEAFALVREASKRTVGLRHFDVQFIAATVLAQGKVAEQKTGEGKTLSAVPALYLHSLTGKPVHLVTVNDYLARRDAGWMGAIFNLLGVSVSSIISEKSFVFDPNFTDGEAEDYRLVHLREISRKEAYQKNIVYGINSEFGFDYLRDNMVYEKEEMVQPGHYFAVIDEVDSVLIDEARTPHIISAPDATPSQKYYEYAKIVDKLNPTVDYKIDEKLRTAHLTDHGISKIETMYGIKDIYEKDFDTVYHIEAALKARTLFSKNKDYIVRENQVILVDEFTGRLLEGRRLSEGLHQAIEAKENVAIQQESKTLATVSLQNYFRMYEKLAGMTGTAATEAEEFHKIYKLDVVTIPTNRDMIREDLSDLIYKTNRAKITAIVKEIEDAHKKGQPVLVGTTSIEKNEIISQILKRKGVKHELLNAKNHEREALIIKDAGKLGAVTVATNMAGRGVDIILGGQQPSQFEVDFKDKSKKKEFEKEYKEWEKEHREVVEAGGLYVIGTEKHESRRIDNQLRGRSGRQGDPGKSVFIVSLEDDLMRVFGGDQISNLMTRFNFPEDTPLTHPLVTKVIEQAQVKVEGFNFESRKHLLDFDDVLNKQREIVYKLRRSIVENKEDISTFVLEKVQARIEQVADFNLSLTEADPYQNIVDEFVNIIPFDETSKQHLYKQIQQMQNRDQVIEFLSGIVGELYEKRNQDFGKDQVENILRIVSISTINNLWMDHLTAIEDLRTGIGLRSYGQKDPLVEYKNEAFRLFERLMISIDDEIVDKVFKINIAAMQPRNIEQPKKIFTNQPKVEISGKAANENRNENKKLGRNDPCWCSSGKKWKKCHYPQIG